MKGSGLDWQPIGVGIKVPENSKDFSWLVARALILGLGIRICLRIFSAPVDLIIPLVDFGPMVIVELILSCGLAGFAIWLAFNSFKRSSYIFLFCLGVFSWISNYSQVGAFPPHVALLCVFGYLGETCTPKDRSKLASLFLGAAFLAAASFKFNSNYLAGKEFLPDGGFFHFAHQFNDISRWIMASGWIAVLPALSIGIEIVLGLSALYFRWTGHLSLIFILLLSLLHQHVFFVYYCFLPLVVTNEPKLMAKIESLRGSHHLTSPFFWYFLIILTTPIPYRSPYQIEFALMALALILAHTYWVGRELFRDGARLEFIGFRLPPKLLVMPGLVATTVLLKWLGAPTPIGYSMFAGLSGRAPAHRMKIADSSTCQRLRPIFRFTVISDAKFFLNPESDDSGCSILFPSKSGIELIKRKICMRNSEVEWDYLQRGGKDWIHETCHQLATPSTDGKSS